MTILLNEVEVRVLGCLIEKDITTPDYYPLSLNALTNACNQKSNRDPVMELDEDAVRLGLRNLKEKNLAGYVNSSDSRVTKYEHHIQEVFNFTRPETAVICVLLLRGPQTPGELRSRGERMHRFEHLDDVQSALQKLMERDPPLAKMLPRVPGTKEARYAHLLAGDVGAWEPPAESRVVISGLENERMLKLEEEVAELKREVEELRQRMEKFSS